MAVKISGEELVKRLPGVRGRLSTDVLLSDLTWFRVGGPAEVVFSPADDDDLAGFLKELPDDIPVLTIGIGSNLLVRDGGIHGVVIRLGRGFPAVVRGKTTKIFVLHRGKRSVGPGSKGFAGCLPLECH